MKNNLALLRQVLSRREKMTFLWLILYSLIDSAIEIAALASLMPLIAITLNPNYIQENKYLVKCYKLLGFNSPKNFVIFFSCIVIALLAVRGVLHVHYLYSSNKFSHDAVHKIRTRVFKSFSRLNYRSFLNRNSSELFRDITVEANNIYHILFPTLAIVSEAIASFLIISIVFVAEWRVATTLFIFMGIFSVLLTVNLKKVLARQGHLRASLAAQMQRVLNETVGNYKFLKLTQKNLLMEDRLNRSSKSLSAVNSKFMVLQSAPRYILETVGFGIIVGIILYAYIVYEHPAQILSIVGIYAATFYRILPSVNKIIMSYNSLRYYSNSASILLTSINSREEIQDVPDQDDVFFQKEIKLNNVHFSYSTSNHPQFKSFNLSIPKGKKIGIVGHSGAGKTTLIDIIIGLLRPDQGALTVDGRVIDDKNVEKWRSKVGYIPQQIYLFDGTVAENVCFGYEYDEKRVIEVLKLANIYDFLQTKNGLKTMVGENALQLSGGQKQRIAIARAFYHDPEIVILDEATSALDEDIEKKIMNDIYEICNQKTLIMIAHRKSTVKKCDEVFNLSSGSWTSGASYAENF